MHIECVQEKIEDAVSRAASITGKDLSLPVLECVLLEATDNNLVVKSTNLEIGIEITVPVKVKNKGTVAVPADILQSFLSNLPEGDNAVLKHEDNTLSVTTSHSETHINTRAHDEFPSIPRIDSDNSISLPTETLREGFKSVYYSASPSSMKPELSSVNVFVEDQEVVFVATDSFRLAEKRINVKDAPDLDSVLIPFKNVSEIIQAFSDSSGSVTFDIGENQVALSVGNVYITSRIIDGVFPDYKQIIPDEQDTEVVVLKQDLVNTLKLSNIFADKFNKVTISVDPEEKQFTIETNNADIGENTGALDASLSGESITANFNYRYIMDCFQSIDADSVSLELSDNNPMTIRGVGDSSFLYLVMPMNK